MTFPEIRLMRRLLAPLRLIPLCYALHRPPSSPSPATTRPVRAARCAATDSHVGTRALRNPKPVVSGRAAHEEDD